MGIHRRRSRASIPPDPARLPQAVCRRSDRSSDASLEDRSCLSLHVLQRRAGDAGRRRRRGRRCRSGGSRGDRARGRLRQGARPQVEAAGRLSAPMLTSSTRLDASETNSGGATRGAAESNVRAWLWALSTLFSGSAGAVVGHPDPFGTNGGCDSNPELGAGSDAQVLEVVVADVGLRGRGPAVGLFVGREGLVGVRFLIREALAAGVDGVQDET